MKMGLVWDVSDANMNKESERLTCFVDADFCGNYLVHVDQSDDAESSRSRYGYVLKYENMPIVWDSKLQTVIALSSTESEYIALSEASRVIIPIIRQLIELKERGLVVSVKVPTIRCKMYEDNAGALTMANNPKMRSRTKNMHSKYHHFLSLVTSQVLVIRKISTEEQQADILTKPLSIDVFAKLREMLAGW